MSEPQYRLEGIVHTRTEVREDFEGPLDVIFLLLSKNKIEIQDVSITAILEQYLAYLDEMKRLDMEIASEFITMASHLMLIKTKMLLSAAEQQEAEDELEMISERSQRQLPPPTQNFKGIVGKEPYPVARKSGEVLRQLLLRGVERLKSLFRGNKTRSEVVATFLAILELCKTNAITLEDDTSGENPNVRLLEKQPIVEGEMS